MPVTTVDEAGEAKQADPATDNDEDMKESEAVDTGPPSVTLTSRLLKLKGALFAIEVRALVFADVAMPSLLPP